MIKFAKIDELPAGECRAFTIGDRQVAVFNVEENLYAVEDRCPHREAKLSAGEFNGAVVTCPLHRWNFNVITGECVDQPGFPLRKFDVQIDGDDICIEDALLEARTNKWDGVYRYLVRYGSLGWVARFGSIEPIDCGRGDRLVIRTDRGTELGEALTTPTNNSQAQTNGEQPTGEVVRVASNDELTEHRSVERQQLLQDVIDECTMRLDSREIPAQVIDGELLFDGETVVLYFLGEQSEAMGKLAVDLTNDRDVKVMFQPAVDQPPSGGCGMPGCGAGGCSAE